MAELTVQTSAPGVSPVFSGVSGAGGDTFKNAGDVLLLVQVEGGAERTLTVRTPHPGRLDYTETRSSPSWMTSRWDPLWWNDPATGLLTFEFDDPTGVSVAAVRFGVIGADPGSVPEPGLF